MGSNRCEYIDFIDFVLFLAVFALSNSLLIWEPLGCQPSRLHKWQPLTNVTPPPFQSAIAKFPPDVQHILAQVSGILSPIHLILVANRDAWLRKALSFGTFISLFCVRCTGPEVTGGESRSRLSLSVSSESTPRPSARQVQNTSSSRPSTSTTCQCHATFGARVRLCNPPCSFVLKENQQMRQGSPKISTTNLPGSNCSFSVCDSLTRRRFLVDTGTQIHVVHAIPTDHRCPNIGLNLQVRKFPPPPISILGNQPFTLSISLRYPFSRTPVTSDIPHTILGSDSLAKFNLVLECHRARPLDRTTCLPVCGLTPLTTSNNLSVPDTGTACLYRKLLLQNRKLKPCCVRSV
ncbi:hypothetical protein SprV_0802622200 [Sparganum proliferum]